MNISEFSTYAYFEGVDNKIRLQRAEAKTASFVHGIPGEPPPPSVADITKALLAQNYPGITMASIKGPSRVHSLVQARRHLWATVHEQRPDLSIATLARLFNRDHSTILTGIRRHSERETS